MGGYQVETGWQVLGNARALRIDGRDFLVAHVHDPSPGGGVSRWGLWELDHQRRLTRLVAGMFSWSASLEDALAEVGIAYETIERREEVPTPEGLPLDSLPPLVELPTGGRSGRFGNRRSLLSRPSR